MDKKRILAIDDDSQFLSALDAELSKNFELKKAESVPHAIQFLAKQLPDLILLDMNLPEISGIDFLRVLRQKNLPVPVIMLTGQSDPETIVSAMRSGASDYIVKGANDFLTSLELRISQVLALQGMKQENAILSSKIKADSARYEILGVSSETLKLRAEIAKYRNTSAFVLIMGENGTGKELIARTLNLQEDNPTRPFVAVNCGAISQGLFESELFGHVRGAFTGATTDQMGKFVAASGGDIFLDEIGELPPDMQVKLLRVLQEKVVTPVGSTKNIPVNIRVISATNKKLEDLVAQKRFRQDLYYRLNPIVIRTHALRERPEDILFLAQSMARRILPGITISREAKRILENHSWPGNIRELQNTIERACIMIRGTNKTQILPEHLVLSELQAVSNIAVFPPDLLPLSPHEVTHQNYRLSLDWMEKKFFERASQLFNGDNTAIIKKLDLSKSYYYRRRKELGEKDGEVL